MPVIISSEYLDRLCERQDYEGLVWISGVLCGTDRFRRGHPTYGLPGAAFSIVERLEWFAQAVRSGAWTYHEVTSAERHTAMLTGLQEDTDHPEFAEYYEFGMRNWRIPVRLRPLDLWIDANDELNNDILWQTISAHRELILDLAQTGP